MLLRMSFGAKTGPTLLTHETALAAKASAEKHFTSKCKKLLIKQIFFFRLIWQEFSWQKDLFAKGNSSRTGLRTHNYMVTASSGEISFCVKYRNIREYIGIDIFYIKYEYVGTEGDICFRLNINIWEIKGLMAAIDR